ncbi:MAG: hypothetical protein HY235_30340 [Acidobacteria bacterium]|nr:hypothetical protein [Acidobacteriota bacterium]
MPRPRKLVKDINLLSAALEGLEAQRLRLDEQIRQVRAMLGKVRRPAAAAKPRRKGKMSASARKRISLAQKKRWARFRKEKSGAEA